ncbi:MAG: Fic family protein [Flavobacteriaceae bacterium]|jgi:cell filamentation protein|nr:Fic family protein [Flavobacteriaceae bacterium]
MKDPYLYSDGETLINLFEERDEQRLAEIEAVYTALRLRQLCDEPQIGLFDFKHLCNIHQFIFQDIFHWAGQPRIIDIEKAEAALGGLSVEYSDVRDIQNHADSACKKMNGIPWKSLHIDEKAEYFSKSMAELWKVHPFREGNTRTIITFCCDFAEQNDFRLNRELFKDNSVYVRRALAAASAVFTDLGDFSQPQHLIKIVRDAID